MYDFRNMTKNDRYEPENSPNSYPIVSELSDIIGNINFDENNVMHLKKDHSNFKNKQEEIFKLIISTSNDAIVILNNNDKVSFWNKAAEKMFGYSEEEILAKDLYKILIPKFLRQASIEKVQKFKNNSHGDAIGKTLELLARRKNGEEFSIELSLSALNIDSEWISIGVVRDISDRKKKEEKVKQQATFVNNNPAPVLMSNKIGVIIDANPSAKEIYNSDLIGTDIYTLFNKFDKKSVQNLNQNHFTQFEDVINDKIFLFTVNEDIHTNLYYFFGSDISDKKRVDEELRKSEEKFRSLVQNSSIGFYRSNKSGEILFVNHTFLNMLGYETLEDLKKEKKATDLYVNPEEREIFQSILEDEGTIFDFETKLKRLDGTEILVKESAKVIKNQAGQEIIYQGTIQDISKEKKDQVQIKNLYRAIEQSNVSVVITDSEGIIEYVNKKFQEITGYTNEEVIGINPSVLKSGDKSEDFYRNLWNTIKSGNVWTGELLNKKKNGKLFWEAATISPVKDENGIVTNFVAVKEDVTQSKLLIEKLKENEERFRVITDSSGDAFYRLNYETMQYDYMHPNIEKLTGYSSQEINLSSILIKMEQNNKPIDAESLLNRRNKKSEESCEVDYLIKTKNGELKWLADRSYFWYDNSGNVIGAMGVLADLTKRKEIEKKLIDAKEAAEKATRMKTEFISQMSHEIRTPLNIILSFIELLKDDLKEKIGYEEFENLNIIDSSGKRLVRTIDSILNFSEILSGSYEPINEDMNLFDDVLKQIYNEYQFLAKEKSLEFTLLNNVKHKLISADKYSVIQIFSHLVDNSIKFTKSGNVEINLTSLNGKLIVKISDTGIGISDEYLSKIFEPFTQEDCGYSRKFDGNGIGLALVKKYCDLNNITIGINSTKNKGTTVQLIFNNSKINN